MPGGSFYQQTKHRRITGMVDTVRASKCLNCGGLTSMAEMFKGWCMSCLASWGATADPAAIESGRAEYQASVRVGEPPTVRAYERLKDRIADRPNDEWFIPLTLYLGNYTIGQAQANWNFIQALYELEVMTTGHAFKIGKSSHDTLHVCGRHAPMQSLSLASFMGRVVHSESVWKTIEPRLKEYIGDFIAQQGIGFRALCGPRTRIDRYATDGRSRRSYRIGAVTAKATFQTVPNFWPFAVRQAPQEHDMLHAIDRATRGIPEQWRQDVCQDLVVAVLSGETTLDNLRDAIPKHVSQVFKMHPIKYGDVSLDAPIPFMNVSRTLADVLAAVEQEDREDRRGSDAELDRCGWHEGFDRPVGLASLAEVVSVKRNQRKGI